MGNFIFYLGIETFEYKTNEPSKKHIVLILEGKLYFTSVKYSFVDITVLRGIFITRGQFWSPGIVVACVCVCVSITCLSAP